MSPALGTPAQAHSGCRDTARDTLTSPWGSPPAPQELTPLPGGLAQLLGCSPRSQGAHTPPPGYLPTLVEAVIPLLGCPPTLPEVFVRLLGCSSCSWDPCPPFLGCFSSSWGAGRDVGCRIRGKESEMQNRGSRSRRCGGASLESVGDAGAGI